MTATRFYAPPLDGLRAVAFALVFCSHVPGLWFFPGGFGVTVFFFLSGYLITTLLRLEVRATGRIDVAAFFGRRVLRILPPYFLTLGLVWAVAAASGAALRGEAFAWQALFATNYWVVGHGDAGLPPGSEVYWSLAVEEHFYLLFPWVAIGLFRGLSRGASRAAVLLGACAVVLGWRVALFWWLDPGDAARLTYASDTRIDSILFGCVLALWGNPVLDPVPPALARHAGAMLGAAGLGLGLTLVPRDPTFRETLRYTLQGLLLLPVYHALLARQDLAVARWLARPGVRWLGVLSYTLYLVHDSALAGAVGLVGRSPGAVALAAGLALAGSIAYAAAMHRWVERPLARWRARLRR
ncbi:MAG: acyltransferase [Myxococcota bacterium]